MKLKRPTSTMPPKAAHQAPNTVTRKIRMSTALASAIQSIASFEERSFSSIVRSLCLYGLKRRGVTLGAAVVNDES